MARIRGIAQARRIRHIVRRRFFVAALGAALGMSAVPGVVPDAGSARANTITRSLYEEGPAVNGADRDRDIAVMG